VTVSKDPILTLFRDDNYRVGNCFVRVYDRRRPDIWGDHFLRSLYDRCKESRILRELFCGMVDLSADAICAYLHTLSPLLIMCVDPVDPDGVEGVPPNPNLLPSIAGFAFPTLKLGGQLRPNPTGGDPLPSEAAMILGYGYFRSFWGTPESVVLGMLTLAYFFENYNLTAVHGQSYPWNRLTAKFTSQFGVKPVGSIPRFLQTAEGKLVDCNLSTLLREDFEKYVHGVIRSMLADSIKGQRSADDGERRTERT
jgi:hypothetical protein